MGGWLLEFSGRVLLRRSCRCAGAEADVAERFEGGFEQRVSMLADGYFDLKKWIFEVSRARVVSTRPAGDAV
jgi:hypothetical protein